ncbi:MAG: DUF1062 domain-containing protein [Clostridiales bacterium]|nr:DUF1062 domain-containing protein [Clostridiales bacterium]
MSYLKKIEYEIVIQDSFWVIWNCAKCGRKTHFKNTKKFRINANGNKLDIWLIYQCEKCKHTLNLSIYERCKVSSILKEEYRRFLDNDEEFAQMYGKNMQLFKKNRANIDWEKLNYDFVKRHETMENNSSDDMLAVTISNPYQLKIRLEKQISEVLDLSVNQVKSLIKKGDIAINAELPQSVSFSIRVENLPTCQC